MEVVVELKNKSQSLQRSASWKNDDSYTADALINAYLKDTPDALDNKQKIHFDTIEGEFLINTNAVEELLPYLKANGITVHELFLKFNDIGDYEMLVVVDESDFKSNDLIDKSYIKSGEVMLAVNNESFNLDISFVEKTKYFNRKRVISDGFGIVYVGE